MHLDFFFLSFPGEANDFRGVLFFWWPSFSISFIWILFLREVCSIILLCYSNSSVISVGICTVPQFGYIFPEHRPKEDCWLDRRHLCERDSTEHFWAVSKQTPLYIYCEFWLGTNCPFLELLISWGGSILRTWVLFGVTLHCCDRSVW